MGKVEIERQLKGEKKEKGLKLKKKERKLLRLGNASGKKLHRNMWLKENVPG